MTTVHACTSPTQILSTCNINFVVPYIIMLFLFNICPLPERRHPGEGYLHPEQVLNAPIPVRLRHVRLPETSGAACAEIVYRNIQTTSFSVVDWLLWWNWCLLTNCLVTHSTSVDEHCGFINAAFCTYQSLSFCVMICLIHSCDIVYIQIIIPCNHCTSLWAGCLWSLFTMFTTAIFHLATTHNSV